METLVEVSNTDQVDLAESSGADLLGINNRDLKTMEVELERTKDIIGSTSEDTIVVSESGIRNRSDIEKVIEWGADAVLVGTALMRSDDVEEKTRNFVYGGMDGKN